MRRWSRIGTTVIRLSDRLSRIRQSHRIDGTAVHPLGSKPQAARWGHGGMSVRECQSEVVASGILIPSKGVARRMNSARSVSLIVVIP